jgi:hypothetical protein
MNQRSGRADERGIQDRMRRTEFKILATLALHPNITAYQIERETKLAHSTVDIWLRGSTAGKRPYLTANLVDRGLVKVVSKKKWRTGLQRKEYALTFKGLLDYFSYSTRATVEGRVKFKEEPEKVIKNYKDSHVIFQYWNQLKDSIRFKPNIGGGLHGVLMEISNLTYHSFPFPMEWPEVFNREYPMAALGYEGLFSFNFLGFLAGLKEDGSIEIVKPLPDLSKQLKPVVDNLQTIFERINGFVKSLSN